MTQTECLEELYPKFIECGYSPLLFEELSPAEIVDMITGYWLLQEREYELHQEHIKENIHLLDGVLIALIHNLAAVMPGNDNVEAITLKSLFPQLFPTTQSKGGLTLEMQQYKANRIQAAQRFNDMRHQEGG